MTVVAGESQCKYRGVYRESPPDAESRRPEWGRLFKFRNGLPRSNVRITSELSSYRITKETPAQRTSLLGRDRDFSLCVRAGSDRAL